MSVRVLQVPLRAEKRVRGDRRGDDIESARRGTVVAVGRTVMPGAIDQTADGGGFKTLAPFTDVPRRMGIKPKELQ